MEQTKMRLLERYDSRPGEGFGQEAYINYGTICDLTTNKYDGWYVVLRSPFKERKDCINHNTFNADKKVLCRWTVRIRHRPAYKNRKSVTTIENHWVPVERGYGYD
jgi:hypothetical protein